MFRARYNPDEEKQPVKAKSKAKQPLKVKSLVKEDLKPKISVGQALLILLDKYQTIVSQQKCKLVPPVENKEFSQLKKLYFLGAQNPEDLNEIEKWLEHESLRCYEVSRAPEVINDDPTRRYFETHLALAILKGRVFENIDIEDLKKHSSYLEKLVPTAALNLIEEVFAGNCTNANNAVSTDLLCAQEYCDALHRLQSPDHYKDFSKKEKEKMVLMVKCSYFCIIIPKHVKPPVHKDLPIDIYSKGYFIPINRGVVRKEPDSKEPIHPGLRQLHVRSHNMGLLRSYMPLSIEDTAHVKSAPPYLRVADRHVFDPNSAWAKDNFSRLVHPFSCSISGTMLVHQRIFKYLHDKDQLVFNNSEKYINFLKALIPLLIFNSGGHTFHEFMFPLQLQEVQEAFAFIKDFNKLNIEHLFLHGCESAFNAALADTIHYHRVLLAKQNTHHALKLKFSGKPKNSLFDANFDKYEKAKEDVVQNNLDKNKFALS